MSPPPPVPTQSVRDEFNAVSFANNDGTALWEGDWTEYDVAGAGPGAGNVDVTDGEMRLRDMPDTGTQPSLAREVDLSDATTATFSFDYRTTVGVDNDDAVAVEVSSDGGASYTLIETFTGISGETSGSRLHNLSNFISADTVIRFRVSNKYGASSEYFVVDNVQIEAQ